jgi:hypothetical protein
MLRAVLSGCSLALLLGCLSVVPACHQTFTPPEQPDLHKDPLRFDLGTETMPVDDLGAHVDLPPPDLLGKPDLTLSEDRDQGNL